jgi:diphosphomevalonate decarboxylase
VTEPRVDWEVETVIASSKHARVFSPSNIALAKYWGKRNSALNLPTNGSLSVTLKGYGSFTTVEFDASFTRDRIILNGRDESDTKLDKVARVLDELRALAGVKTRARVQSRNNFPTGAGLASSASGLSAVTAAGAWALGLDLPASKLSEIARKGSGSACRSFFGGFAEWKRGELADGTDSVAAQVAGAAHWPLKIFIAVASGAQKNHASTGGMEHTRKTSPYFAAWIDAAQASVPKIREAVKARDFENLAGLAESNCIQFHASAMAAVPPVFYWQGATVELMHRVWGLRASGTPAFFTIDAGPNVVVLCEPGVAARVRAELAQVGGVQLLETEVGEGTRRYDAREWRGE